MNDLQSARRIEPKTAFNGIALMLCSTLLGGGGLLWGQDEGTEVSRLLARSVLVDLGDDLELFVDYHLIDRMKGTPTETAPSPAGRGRDQGGSSLGGNLRVRTDCHPA